MRQRVCSILKVAGKFCLAHGLQQLTRDTKSEYSCLQTSLIRRHEILRMKFRVSHFTKLNVKKRNNRNIVIKSTILAVIGTCTKNNQSVVSDENRENPDPRVKGYCQKLVKPHYGVVKRREIGLYCKTIFALIKLVMLIKRLTPQLHRRSVP